MFCAVATHLMVMGEALGVEVRVTLDGEEAGSKR